MSQMGHVSRFVSTAADPKPLGAPMTYPISKRNVSNRFLKTSMSELMASYDKYDAGSRGIPSPEMIRLYEVWGQGGWGQVLTGNIMIDCINLEEKGNAVIPADAAFSGPRFDAFAALATATKRHGSLIVGQISHPGRQVKLDINPHPISASAAPIVGTTEVGSVHGVPRAASLDEIAGVVAGFAHAAAFLERAGFDGIMLHAAHGYLLSQFLSRASNKRTDAYGGSLEGRMKLVLEIAAAIKRRVQPGFILGIKINSVEFQDQGFSSEEAVRLCRALEQAGFDYVETSGGNYERAAFHYTSESTQRRENYFIEFAEQIAQAVTNMKVYTTGGFKTTAAMVDALRFVDGVGIGRASTQEPRLARDLLLGDMNGVQTYAFKEDEFGPRMLASVYQMHQLGRGDEPADLSDPTVVKEVMGIMMERMGMGSASA